MIFIKKYPAVLFLAVGVLSLLSSGAFAQTNVTATPGFSVVTNVFTTTNVITVTITNYVVITNVLPAVTSVAASTGLKTNAAVAPPKYPWESSITAGLTLTRGNSDTMLVTGKIQTHRKTPDNEITLGGDAAYGESGGIENLYTLHGYTQYNHLFTERFYGYGRVEGLHDGIADLQYRLTVGPGLGYYFVKETNTTFSTELGSSFVNQRLGDESDSYATLRFAETFEHKCKTFGARFWENAELLPQVNKLNNYLINAEVGVEAALNAHFSLKTFLDDNFNNEPASGREKNDIKLVSGVSYKF